MFSHRIKFLIKNGSVNEKERISMRISKGLAITQAFTKRVDISKISRKSPEDLLALVRKNVEKSELVTSKDLSFSVFPARTANIRHFRKSVKNIHLGILLKNNC